MMVCIVMWGLYADYAVVVQWGILYICSVAGIFLKGHLSVMQSVCILVLLVTLLIALSSYEVSVLTLLS